jgi:hypothetical protein
MAKFKCPHCGKEINPAALMGQVTSEAKVRTAIENGKKGGRPRKKDAGGDTVKPPTPETSAPEKPKKRTQK